MATIQGTIKTGEPYLGDMLEEIHTGKIQLPDFQRPWVWDDPHIRALIGSVSLGYPIGAVMLLETGGQAGRFQPRLVEGVKLEGPPHLESLILDGQQRLTSLYLSLRSGRPVTTRTEKDDPIDRVYYLDITKCLDPEIERLEAVLALPPDRVLRSDFNRKVDLDASSTDKEAALSLFPLDRVFDSVASAEWRQHYERFHNYSPTKLSQYSQFESQVIHRFQKYRVPLITLLKDTPKEAVCQVFERVNTGGVALSVFELMTATFAADDFRLQADWETRAKRLKERDHTPLRDLEGTEFLTAVTLFASYKRHKAKGTAVASKRKDILNLKLEDYKECADVVEEGFQKAARFLVREKVFDQDSLPYQTQLVPLSAICAWLGNRFEEDGVRQKLSRWYWSGVFGELYGGANETRFGLDIQDVIAWIEGSGEEPRTIRDANLAPLRLLSLQTRLSAAYKGVMALLIQEGSDDFISGDPVEINSYFERAIEIHHIFPRAYCEKQKYSKAKWNSIVNKTPISERTNRIVGGNAPSQYCNSIQKNHKVDAGRLDVILGTHLVQPGLLRGDEFDQFIRDRAVRLLDIIERAMGKAITGRDSVEVVQAYGGPLAIPESGALPSKPKTTEAIIQQVEEASDDEDEGPQGRGEWEVDGKSWHLKKRCSESMAGYLVGLAALCENSLKGLKVDWNQKKYVTFVIGGYNWAYLDTGPNRLDLKLYTTRPDFDGAAIARELKVGEAAPEGSSKTHTSSWVDTSLRPDGYYRIRLQIRDGFDMGNPALQALLERWRATIAE